MARPPPVAQRPRPRSARRPAAVAARAPAAPASPKSPMVAGGRWWGGPASRKAMVVQSTLNAPKIAAPNSARVRSTGSSR